MTVPKRLVITPGEPAGIGPDLIIQLAQEPWPAELVVIASPQLLLARARQLRLPLSLVETDCSHEPLPHQSQKLAIFPVDLPVPATPGKLERENAHYVLECLTLAANLCHQGEADALVTGPVHKAIINAAGHPFTGHTEYLKDHLSAPQVLMLFVVGALRVALATTHLPLAEVPRAITPSGLESSLRLLHQGLQQWFGITEPRIMVCGLNPHAGEDGLLGDEEKTCITPALNPLRSQGMTLIGPVPADTAFTPDHLLTADAIFAMYHDQALPVVKHRGFHEAVNVTLGLPIIRTSVDHGTALTLAGTGRAHPGSLRSAINLAIQLAHTRV